jgi:sigma-B regulation protein RsbQ
MGNPEKPELALELEESFCVNNPKIAKHFAKVTFFCDNREDLEKVDIKTLVIQCAEDSLAAVRVGEFVNSKIKGSELTVLNTNGHCPHLSNPNETIQAMTEFLVY